MRRNFLLWHMTSIAMMALPICLAPAVAVGQGNSKGLLLYQSQGLHGLMDSEGNPIIPAAYQELGWSEGLPEFKSNVIGFRKNGEWGLLDSENKVVLTARFLDLRPSKDDNLFEASRSDPLSGDRLFGVIDRNGSLVIPFVYEDVRIAGRQVIASLKENNLVKYGVVNLDNMPVLPFDYNNIYALDGPLLAVVRRSGKISLFDMKGSILLSYEIDSIGKANFGTYRIYRSGRIGLIDSKGKIIAEPEYKRLTLEKDKINLLAFNRWRFLDTEGNELGQLRADHVRSLTSNLFIVRMNQKDQLAKLDWKGGDSDPEYSLALISKEYDEVISRASSFSHYQVTVGSRSGVISRTGNLVIPTAFDSVALDVGLIYTLNREGKNDHWSLFDTLGRERSAFKYSHLRPIREGRLATKRKGKWGFIDQRGTEVIPCVFDEVSDFKNGKSKVVFHGEQGAIDNQGNWVLFPKPSQITFINDSLYLERSIAGKTSMLKSLSGDLIYFTQNPLTTFSEFLVEAVDSLTEWHISLYGTILSKAVDMHSSPIPFCDSLFVTFDEAGTGLSTSWGKQIIPNGQYQEILPDCNEFIGIRLDGFYGFVDLDNKLRIANRYDLVKPFKSGLASVKIRQKWGFIDTREEIVVQPAYDEVLSFQDGLCEVRLGKLWGLIDLEGKAVQPVEFSSIKRTAEGLFIVRRKSDFGLLSKDGIMRIHPKYDYLDVLGNGQVIVGRRNQYGILSQMGVIEVPVIYDNLDYLPATGVFVTREAGKWETRALSFGNPGY